VPSENTGQPFKSDAPRMREHREGEHPRSISAPTAGGGSVVGRHDSGEFAAPAEHSYYARGTAVHHRLIPLSLRDKAMALDGMRTPRLWD